MAFKDSVRINKVNAYVMTAIMETAPPLQGDCVVFTSINDSIHRAASSHYSNDAWDVRTHPSDVNPNRLGSIVATTNEIRDRIAQGWAGSLRRRLGPDYDVMYEASSFHIHVEIDRS